jgi:ubiquinone/menaquinone biosynthesis C-methylase UbiE
MSLLKAEIDCLRPLTEDLGHPRLEVGVGTGRFAQALGFEYGIDPSDAMLQFAARRGIETCRASGESLPYENRTFEAVLMVFTLCFVQNPENVLSEIERVLEPGGALVIGIIPAGTPWADAYIRRGREGNPFYANAHFYSIDQLQDLLTAAGFKIERARSALMSPPCDRPVPSDSVDGIVETAGFVTLRCRKQATVHRSQ